jgi:hypothetical protein
MSLPAKILVAAMGLALFVPAAADAGQKQPHRTHPAARHAAHLRAAAPRTLAATSQTVVFGDRVIGADPDPRIRHELLRDLGVVFGGND